MNRGILEAHAAGTLSAASMMANAPASAEAAVLVRERAGELSVGVHLDLVSGRPLARVPTLVDARTGDFHPLPVLVRRALCGLVEPADVRRECDAQIAALRAAGIAPTHLDSHRHTHALPGILPAVLASARSAGIRIVRRPLDRPSWRAPVTALKMLALHASWRVAARPLDAESRSFAQRSRAFRGIALQGADDVQQRLLALLDALPTGTTEIMLHPGYDDDVLAACDPYRAARERELAALRSPAVRERLARGDPVLVRPER